MAAVSAVGVPISAVVVAVTLGFGNLEGGRCAWAGAMASAYLGFVLGRRRLGPFLVGTAISLVPGIVAVTFVGDRLAAALRDPAPATAAVVVVLVAAVVASTIFVRTRLRRAQPWSD